MLFYIYDGSFDGLLTAIYEAYYRKERPNKILFEEDFQESLLINKIIINTDEEKAKKVYKAIKDKISNIALKNVFYTYLSEFTDAGKWIYEYLRLGWKIGKDVDLNLSDERVLRIHKIKQKVSRERHLLLGLIRFREIQGNIYYAPIEPEYNVIGLVAPHFANRFADQNWIIHDVKRGLGAVYNTKEWIIRDIDIKEEIIYEESEIKYQQLWKEYFNSIAIKNRINPKLQRSNMPMKYWKYLIEKSK